MKEDIVLCSRLIQRQDLPDSNRRLACHFAENTIDDDILLSFANNKSNDFLEEQFESYPIDTDIPVYFESSSNSDISDNCIEGASRTKKVRYLGKQLVLQAPRSLALSLTGFWVWNIQKYLWKVSHHFLTIY